MSMTDGEHEIWSELQVDAAMSDQPKVIRESTRTALLSHVCNMCDGEIKPGQEYMYKLLKTQEFGLEEFKAHANVRQCIDIVEGRE